MPQERARRLVSTVVVASVLAMSAVLFLWQRIDQTCRGTDGAEVAACAGLPVADERATPGTGVAADR